MAASQGATPKEIAFVAVSVTKLLSDLSDNEKLTALETAAVLMFPGYEVTLTLKPR